MMRLILSNILLFLFLSLNSIAQDGKFTFTIASPATTSAGVFRTDGTLVRTLWNNVKYNSGSYTEKWDGKNDMGVKITAPDATYQVRILTNNVQYTWQGTIGNTSDSMTGPSKHRGYYHCIKGMAFGSTYGYFCTGYSEASPSLGKFLISNPNQKINFPSSGTHTTANNDFVATDDVTVYWGGFDAYAPNNTFVYGTKVSDDSDADLSSGTSYTVTYGKTYKKSISRMNTANSLISGLAVQKSGTYLFVARSGLNQLQVLNKTTGALVQTLAFTAPRALCVDANGALWMASGTNTLAKYTVNSNGTLSAPVLTIAGLQNPVATQVSPTGILSVADGGTSQQVKFYNNVTGVASGVLGVAGGYVTDPNVNDNKFYFTDMNGTVQYAKISFIAYQQDGSFWVNDPGNFRVQHYDSSKIFLNRIMSLGAKYSVYIDKNNIKRIFGDFLEFEVDYAVQNLKGNSGWKLKKNWGATISDAIYDKSPKYPTTLSNGRTYALLRKGLNSMEVVEYPASGGLRFTGKLLNGVIKILCSDGSLQDYTLSGTTGTFVRYPLTGFDASGNPVWSTVPDVLATGQADFTVGNPVNTPNSQIFTSTDKIVMFNHKAWCNNVGPVFSKGFHLGVMKKGANNKFLFQTEKSTHRNYQGPYPEPGYFDVGNKVNDFAGGNVNFIDRNIITSYHGEFWKDGQTNKYNHYYDNGLAIAQFGITRPEVGFTTRAAAMMAGNALTPVMVKDANGDLYLYHGDESDHAGVHRWKITNLGSVAEQVVSIAYPSSYAAPTPSYTDLMAGLPQDAILATNTAGWTRNPTANDDSNFYKKLWRVNTSKQTYKSLVSNDITVEFLSPVGATNTVNRDLGTNNVTNSWKISGEVIYPSGNNVNWSVAQQFLEVLDVNGKVLTSFYVAGALDGSTAVFGNNTPIATSFGTTLQRKIDNLLPFMVEIIKGKVTFTYGDYPPVRTFISDASGDWKTPKTLRIKMVNNGIAGPAYKQSIGIKDFKFFKEYTTVAYPNSVPIAYAEMDRVITLPINSLTVAGSGTDADGKIVAYNWTKVSGPASGTINSPGSATTTISGLTQGVYLFKLKVTDDEGAVGEDYVQVTVNSLLSLINQTPLASAGGDKVISLPINSIKLIGSGIDIDGSIASYSWTKVAGPGTYTIGTPDASSTLVSNLVQGTYQFRLTISDNDGASNSDLVQVVVNTTSFNYVNLSPVAAAGQDVIVYLPTNSVTLNGIGTDLDGSIESYNWTRVSGTYNFNINSPSAATTKITSLTEGTYQFQLKVLDNNGASAYDYISVIVKKALPKVSTTATTSSAQVSTTLPKFSGTGIDDLVVYPNPVTSQANLTIPVVQANSKITIAVTNASGARVLYKETIIAGSGSPYRLDMSALGTGIYMITVRFEDGRSFVKKVIKSGSK